MSVHHIPFEATGYFSKLICDYLDKKPELSKFYGNYPDVAGFKNQVLSKKATFSATSRQLLHDALKQQYKNSSVSEQTEQNIESLLNENTFTVTTGHQLNIFTGPLYFLYKIVTAINLANRLKKEFPQQNFVPVYWMATEDHDFEEIQYFNVNNTKISWNRESSGAVGRLNLDGFDIVFKEFSALLGTSDNANDLRELFKNAYLKNENLAEATRYLVNEFFGAYGLVIVDGDDLILKKSFAPLVKEELLQNTSFKIVSKTDQLLAAEYKIQVNPREINLFYLKDAKRERVIFEKNHFIINNTDLIFTKDEILQEVAAHPERFSPNVILRPLYQEIVLPNLAYIGGGGELAYWFQLKNYFNEVNVSFPILVLRNSVLLATKKQLLKLKKLDISLVEIFNGQETLIADKVKELSEIKIDFSEQKKYLKQQFSELKELAKKTDSTFLGAVNAQEKKQLNGLGNLEKRLLKAQKRKLSDVVQRIAELQNELFPNQSLQERNQNFSEYYEVLGSELIPMLLKSTDPLKFEFAIIEFE
ncbi:MAG: bacillithiol biosynthesis cysteine-adding enzyme BshC [Bacteroidetes bacterium HGW-Bacteroidetes-3]|jgi:bacillithiol biosynthesis cysteine-adding enzyme BshC|nr:MAG: bacillithiol biosynthesis cysteine-adding enzyme BshC [Bacteroidetes bacterium HGW-Bacteroidetes-3]